MFTMKKLLPPVILLCVLSLAFIVLLDWSNRQLPERVATHFAFNGQPNRWSTRSSAVALMAGFGLALPLLMVGFALMTRFLPEGSINIPNREYWLAPENRAGTYTFVSRQMLWLACLLVCFTAGLNWLLVEANLSNPVRMPSDGLALVMGCFLAGLGVWIVTFILHFRRPPARSAH